MWFAKPGLTLAAQLDVAALRQRSRNPRTVIGSNDAGTRPYRKQRRETTTSARHSSCWQSLESAHSCNLRTQLVEWLSPTTLPRLEAVKLCAPPATGKARSIPSPSGRSEKNFKVRRVITTCLPVSDG